MTNSIAATVHDAAGSVYFEGQRRGICGDATRRASIDQVAMLARLATAQAKGVQIIGVGGASTAEHVAEYLRAGAHAVHLATAAMVDPGVALRIRAAMSS